MKNVILIGATHSLSKDYRGFATVMGPESDKDFFTKYADGIDEETLIITESGFWENIVTPTHKLYKDRLEQISKLLSLHNKKPHLLFADYRHKVKREVTEKYIKQMHQLQNFSNKHIRFSKPNTVEDLKNFVFNEAYECVFLDPPDHTLKTAARNFLPVADETENCFIDMIKKYQNNYKKIFLIVGSTHVLYIAKKENLDFEILKSHYSDQVNLIQVFGSYLYLKKVPQLILTT